MIKNGRSALARRIGAAVLGLGLGAVRGAWSATEDVPLRVATQAYGHTRALQDGSVAVPGCKIQYSTLPLTALNDHAFGDKPYDVTEVEFLPFLSRLAAGEPMDYVLVPVFPLREFQLRHLWVRSDRKIGNLPDLKGKTIGVSGYGSAAPTWIRGYLQSSASVKPEEMAWVDTQSLYRVVPGTAPVPLYSLPEGFPLSAAPRGRTPLGLIDAGRVDALFYPVSSPGKRPLRRLFPDYGALEREEFKESRVFPIVTVLAVRSTLLKEHAWLAEALFMAFAEAKSKATDNLGSDQEPQIPLPWGPDLLQETLDVMGKNYWTYGVPNNPRSLEAILRGGFEQGILAKELKADDVFDSSTLQLIEK